MVCPLLEQHVAGELSKEAQASTEHALATTKIALDNADERIVTAVTCCQNAAIAKHQIALKYVKRISASSH